MAMAAGSVCDALIFVGPNTPESGGPPLFIGADYMRFRCVCGIA
jgi:hypothetical protein